MRLELMTKDSELRRLRDKVDNYEREIQEVTLISRVLLSKPIYIYIYIEEDKLIIWILSFVSCINNRSPRNCLSLSP